MVMECRLFATIWCRGREESLPAAAAAAGVFKQTSDVQFAGTFDPSEARQ